MQTLARFGLATLTKVGINLLTRQWLVLGLIRITPPLTIIHILIPLITVNYLVKNFGWMLQDVFILIRSYITCRTRWRRFLKVFYTPLGMPQFYKGQYQSWRFYHVEQQLYLVLKFLQTNEFLSGRIMFEIFLMLSCINCGCKKWSSSLIS